MNELAFHLDDHVVPLVPIRQFVLTLPFELRFLVARDAVLLSPCARCSCAPSPGSIAKAARNVALCKGLRTAGLCVTQRAGSALNLNPHFHSLFVDGASRDDADGNPVFVATPDFDKKSADRLLARIVARLLSLLRRRGVITSEGFDSSEIPAEAQLTFEAMRLPASSPHGAALHSHNASVLEGFSLHCQSRASAHDHAARLRLFRYILRPAIATNKLAFDGYRVTFEMKRALHDGRRVLHFTPQTFVRRIALLVPKPRSHEVVYCGLFASNAKDRQKVVRVATHRRSITKSAHAHANQPPAPTLPWAELLRRTFDCDIRKCPQIRPQRTLLRRPFSHATRLCEPSLRLRRT